jgi:hypothetical protein
VSKWREADVRAIRPKFQLGERSRQLLARTGRGDVPSPNPFDKLAQVRPRQLALLDEKVGSSARTDRDARHQPMFAFDTEYLNALERKMRSQ